MTRLHYPDVRGLGKVQWIVQEVEAKDLAQALTDFENTPHNYGGPLHKVAGPPILTYVDDTRVIAAWRCWV